MPEAIQINNYNKANALDFVLASVKKLKTSDVEFVKSKAVDPKNPRAIDYSVVLREVRVIAVSIDKPEFLVNKASGFIYGIVDVPKKKFYYFKA